MKRVELTLPLALLEDLGVLSERFFDHNESVEVLQTFSVRPDVAALFVRVRRAGPFKDSTTIRREARSIARRYRLARFEVLSADRGRGEYLAWIEWRVPPVLRTGIADLAGVVPLAIAKAGPGEGRAVLLASETALPRLRDVLRAMGAPYRVRSVRSAPAGAWQPLAGLTARQRDVLALAFRLGYYESPARVSLDRIAGRVGISRAGVSKHLRAAERKVLAAVIGEVGRGG
jgi:DNA-binding CsgD family transcriptional regulator